MKKIVILGCENSHADNFLSIIKENRKYDDVEVIGVYSDDDSAAEKLREKYGVNVMRGYDEAVGKVDGVVVTARHGANHYKYAKPYIKYGVPTFIDKPITVSEEEAIIFMRECKDSGVKITGGSSCINAKEVLKLKKEVDEEEGGKTIGGYVRAPLNMENEYGGFFFYSQHLAEIVMEIFGRYPESVKAYKTGKNLTVEFCYGDYNVTGLYTEGVYVYSAERFSEKGNSGGIFPLEKYVYETEFDNFYSILSGDEQKISYEDFIAPVFVINAIYRSLKNGKEEKVQRFEIK